MRDRDDTHDESRFAFIPHPHRLDLSPARIDQLHTAAERHKMIAEAAYLMAERRGFAPGHELADWLAAEREVNRAGGLVEPWPRWDH